MPLPKPKPGEKQNDFISRCMGNPTMKEEFPKQKQRLAVCFSQWRRYRGKMIGVWDNMLKVIEKVERAMEKAKWTRAYINSLPDAAFALILPGGHKDEEGKTTPRYLRLLPHHDHTVKNPNENKSVDIPHLRNALARCPQVKGITEAQRKRAYNHLARHAKALLPSWKE